MPEARMRAIYGFMAYDEYNKNKKPYFFQMYHLNSDQIPHNSIYRCEGDETIAQTIYDREKSRIERVYCGTNPEIKYPSRQIIPLPQKTIKTSATFENLVRKRRSLRKPMSYKMSLDEIGFIIENSLGITQQNEPTEDCLSRRASPSGGGLYPIEAFFIPLSVSGLERDFYHYRVSEHALARMGKTLSDKELSQCLLDMTTPLNSSLIVILAAFFERSAYKYGERSYRYIMTEAGAILEHVALASEAIGLRSAMIGGYIDPIMNGWIGVNGIDAATIMCGAIGKDRHNGKLEGK